ncbi:MAG TPA: DUF885 family protein [Fimbriimonas sp.]
MTTVPTQPASHSAEASVPDLHELVIEFRCDVEALGRFYRIKGSEARRTRFDRLYSDWQSRLAEVDPSSLGTAGRADLALFRNYLARERRSLEIDAELQSALRRVVPFADSIIELEESRVRMDPIDPSRSAHRLSEIHEAVAEARSMLEEAAPPAEYGYSALELLSSLREAADRWFSHYNGYDPLFTWWVADPYEKLKTELEAFHKLLEDKTLGSKAAGAIVGRAVGREAILADLSFEMIPYTPEELIGFGEREYAWCLERMVEASRELGFGDDWHAALEHVKQQHVEPGKQTELVRGLALEAIEFVESRGLVTVPELAKETWRMDMMSPERQLVSPFFLGGETIIVSYPTHTMTQQQKLMSMRGNNPHFSRATVQHELIPGHHLQGYMERRNRPYRQVFRTPFWTEGWALYWEMLLWKLDFPRKPEERIGMLFWRMHRCIRIVFSLRFHLGELTPEECVEMLVDKVGHERANAEGEVRRSFNGSYPPLYQAAYMIGGLQMWALRRELVDSGRMTDRQFHDAILGENNIPIAILRAILTGEDPAHVEWRFEK